MSDPITIGTFVAGVISAGAGALAKGALGAAGKDAYEALRNAAAKWTGNDADVANLEAAPSSNGRQIILAEIVDNQMPEGQLELAVLSKALIAALQSEEPQNGPIGIDIGQLEAMEVQLDRIRVTEGIGFRAGEIKAEGTFSIGGIETGGGKTPGKA